MKIFPACLIVALATALPAQPSPGDSAQTPVEKKASAQTPAENKPKAPPLPAPTQADVSYGTDERQVLDFWKAESPRPTPLLFFIHGGGWVGGDKERAGSFLQIDGLLKAGISVVSINYRYIARAQADGIRPPVKAPLHDAARAPQFVRSKAAEWNIDQQRIGASGGSAGACSSLWLAFHPDLADPGASGVEHNTVQDHLLEKLKAPSAR